MEFINYEEPSQTPGGKQSYGYENAYFEFYITTTAIVNEQLNSPHGPRLASE